MIKIDDDLTTIHLTRGDASHEGYNRICFYFPIWDFENDEETRYEFQPTDEITLIVFEKKGYTKRELLNKSYTLSEIGYATPTETPEIELSAEDTEVFEKTNKRKTYFYEIKLNGDTTIIGSDEDGDKKIIVYPSGEAEGSVNP